VRAAAAAAAAAYAHRAHRIASIAARRRSCTRRAQQPAACPAGRRLLVGLHVGSCAAAGCLLPTS
jgi:hypothetical protein